MAMPMRSMVPNMPVMVRPMVASGMVMVMARCGMRARRETETQYNSANGNNGADHGAPFVFFLLEGGEEQRSSQGHYGQEYPRMRGAVGRRKHANDAKSANRGNNCTADY